jgi:hypothetical protein
MKTSRQPILSMLITALALVALSFGSVSPAAAQSSLPLIVSPARQQIIVNPGEEASFTVKFYNESETPLSGIVKIADFIVQNTDGSPRIIDDASQASPKFAASSWVNMPYDRMTILGNDMVTVQANLVVPQDARPGGRYIALYFEPSVGVAQAVGNESGAQGVAPRIASLLYIRVAGTINESAIITNLFAPSFSEYGPVTVSSEILNRGDYHIRPRGILSLTDPFGSTIEQTPLEEVNIFPDAARTYENKLGTKWMMGRYKITLVASYGEKGQALERSIYFWVFPWKIAAMIALALIILVLLARGAYKRIIIKESTLEAEIKAEREEIEKLRDELKHRKE